MGGNSSSQFKETERRENMEHEKTMTKLRLDAEKEKVTRLADLEHEKTVKLAAVERAKSEKLAELERQKFEKKLAADKEANIQIAAERNRMMEKEIAIEREKIIKEADVKAKEIEVQKEIELKKMDKEADVKMEQIKIELEKAKERSQTLRELGKQRMADHSELRKIELRDHDKRSQDREGNRAAAQNKEMDMMMILMIVLVGGVVISIATGNLNGSSIAVFMAFIAVIGGYVIFRQHNATQIKGQELRNEAAFKATNALEDKQMTKLAMQYKPAGTDKEKTGAEAQQMSQKPAIEHKPDMLQGASTEQGASASTEQATTSG